MLLHNHGKSSNNILCFLSEGEHKSFCSFLTYQCGMCTNTGHITIGYLSNDLCCFI